MNKSPHQIRDIHAKLRMLGIDKDAKAEIVSQVTNGRSESCSDLTMSEATEMQQHLNRLIGQQFKVNAELDKKRKKVLSAFHEMDYRIPGTDKLDMIRVNETIFKYGFAKKHLNQYSLDELSKLIIQVNRMKSHYIKRKYEVQTNP